VRLRQVPGAVGQGQAERPGEPAGAQFPVTRQEHEAAQHAPETDRLSSRTAAPPALVA